MLQMMRLRCVFSLLFLFTGVGSFGVPVTTRRQVVKLFSSNSGGSSESKKGRTYYDILEVSPSASQEELRKNYLRLARKTHPDAASQQPGEVPFSQIAEAWKTLGDRKKRLQYDRNLLAKEFTDNMGKQLDAGIRTAIPFLGKTAKTTMEVLETSSQQLNRTAADLERGTNEMLARMEKARVVADLRQKSRTLEQRASKIDEKSQDLQRRLKVDRRDDNLHNNEVELTAFQAQRILDGFRVKYETDKQYKAIVAIDALSQMELTVEEQMQEQLNAQRSYELAQDRAASAEEAQMRAQQRLEEAQLALIQAKKDVTDSKQGVKKAEQLEKQTDQEVKKASVSLEKQQEKTRSALQGQEATHLRNEDDTLKQEIAQCARNSRQLRREAAELEKQAQSVQQQ